MPHLLLHSPPARLPSLLSSSLSSFPSRKSHSIPFPRVSKILNLPLRALPITDVELLDALAGSSSDDPKNHLPAVRSYQNDLARLSVIGAVAADHALTAAAADGGNVADEHLSSGAPTMVVETVFPGSSNERSTVSTRLFLPAKKVKEKAKKLRGSLSTDILPADGSISMNILAITFRQVVLQRLWSFELSVFCPGSERNMDELAEPKDDPIDFCVSSSDEGILSALAEVVCSFALEETKADYVGNADGSASNSLFAWFNKPQMMVSVDSSISICKISPANIVKNATKKVAEFNLAKGNPASTKRSFKHLWWSSPTNSRLYKDGGPAFTDWANEHIPAYRIQIDGNKFKDAKLDGWEKLANNRWEVSLTHFQMVELANILDMFYEDRFTLPYKELSYGLINEFSGISKNKLETVCSSVVKKIKDALGWPGDIEVDKNIGAWIGKVPSYLKIKDSNVLCVENAEINAPQVPAKEASSLSKSISLGTSNSGIQMTSSDVASYEVVLSRAADIIGCQPKNRVAVNHWASNPLVNFLYQQQKLSPGILEPSPKIPRPQETVIIELLMSENPESYFALARPSRCL